MSDQKAAPPQGKKKSNYRKVVLINPKFQWSFVSWMLGLAGVTVAIFYLANTYFFWNFMHEGQVLGLPPDNIYFDFIREQQSKMDLIFFITSIFAFVAIVVSGLFLSHRVAGPLLRLHRHCERLSGTGAFEDVNFRKNDFFMEIPTAFNKMMARYRGEVAPAEAAPAEAPPTETVATETKTDGKAA